MALESQLSESSEGTVTIRDEDTTSQVTIEQESEKGYESDITDSGSELSFETAEKSVQGDTDMSLNSLLSTYDTWASGNTDVGEVTHSQHQAGTEAENSGSLDDNSRKSDVDSSSKNDQTDDSPELSAPRKKSHHKKIKAFWKDSDGTEEASSDSEVPSSFVNPIHGKYTWFVYTISTVLGSC